MEVHKFEPLENGGFSAYILHEDSAFTRKLDEKEYYFLQKTTITFQKQFFKKM